MANLTQLRMLEELDGLLLVDKPEGIQFSTVVKTVKRKFNIVKVGHGGSLDTMASGLMALLINDANKFVDRIMSADREYVGTMKFGGTTDTGDKFGHPDESAGPFMPISDARGDVFQSEPRFCSVRRDGSAMYEVVDTGEHGNVLAHIYRFDLEGGAGAAEPGATVGFSLSASRNLLPRSLARDLGATLMSLRRTRIGRLSVEDAVPFDKLLEKDMKDFAPCVMPISSALQ